MLHARATVRRRRLMRPRTEVAAQECHATADVGKVPISNRTPHVHSPELAPPRQQIVNQPSFRAARAELAGQVENTLDVKRLRKQIDQMGPFDPVTQRHKVPQIPG